MAAPRSGNAESSSTKTAAKSPLTFYFLVVLLLFSTFSILVNNRFVHDIHQQDNVIKSVLKDFQVSNMNDKIKEVMEKVDKFEAEAQEQTEDPVDDDDDDVEVGSEDDHEQKDKEGESNGDDDDGDEEEQKGKGEENGNQKLVHSIANLSCEAYGGPSNEDAEEMVYWEDIPKDALHMSPFHPHKNKKDGDTTPITQFLTFEPDAGGWNNIRMAMGM